MHFISFCVNFKPGLWFNKYKYDFGYNILLHIQLSKKNLFIETTVRRLSGIEKNRSMEEMMSFLQEIHELKQYSVTFTDKLLEESTLKFILENGKNMRSYIHYTKDETDARSIVQNGFKFVDSFSFRYQMTNLTLK